MGKTQIIITHDLIAGDMAARSQETGADKFKSIHKLLNCFSGMGSGSFSAKVDITESATGYIVCQNVQATNTCTLSGAAITAVASGATGDQFNIGATDALSATALAALINSTATAAITNNFTAKAIGNVVFLTCKTPGTGGNALTLAATGGMSASGATMSGGTATNSRSYGSAP